MKLFVTILEETPEQALEAIGLIDADHDGVEIRAEKFGSYDLGAFRKATAKPIIFTRRGLPFEAGVLSDAIAAGIDFVDVEYGSSVDETAMRKHRSLIVLSHHDFDGMPDVESLVRDMRALECAHVKIAVTPTDLAGNERLLRLIGPGTTVIGMGERGLFSRMLAPFRGSELQFVSRSEAASAAPGQLSLHRALEIYGDARESLQADAVFAVAGNPAGRSLSPSIHNRMFREKGVAAAYTIASFENFDEIAAALLDGRLRGVSVTVPFKVDAFRFAQKNGAQIGKYALDSESVNTLVALPGAVAARAELLADNTDVDGFLTVLRQVCRTDRKSAAIVGAGGTARAALLAASQLKIDVTVFNRTVSKASDLASRFGARFETLESLKRFDGEIVINTATADAELDMEPRAGTTWINAAYGDVRSTQHAARLRDNGVQVFDGLDLLHAQAVRQNELFMKAMS